MRSIWKGHIRFSLVTIPIRIYNAVDTEETIRFNQLHKEDNGAVGYEKKCKKCGKALTAEEIVKGYQFEPEQYVIVSPDDLSKIKLKSTKVIEIEGFIDATEVHPSLYEAPYLAGPDGPVAAKTYSLLSQALKASGKVAVGKVVLRDREEVVTIAPQDGGLMLYKLRQPNEIRKVQDVPQLESKDANKDELKLSISLRLPARKSSGLPKRKSRLWTSWPPSSKASSRPKRKRSRWKKPKAKRKRPSRPLGKDELPRVPLSRNRRNKKSRKEPPAFWQSFILHV